MVKSDDALFTLVGAGYKKHMPQPVRPTVWKKLRKLPLVSIAALLLIVLACAFAPMLANHDPKGFYYDALNKAPNADYYFGTDTLGRDLYSMTGTLSTDSIAPSVDALQRRARLFFAAIAILTTVCLPSYNGIVTIDE